MTWRQWIQIPHGLGRILNPMTAAEAMALDNPKLSDNNNQLLRETDKRSPRKEEASGSANSATHALYWKTMREFFSHESTTAPNL